MMAAVAIALRPVWKWGLVNGGVLLVAAAVAAAEAATETATASPLLASLASTALLYACVYSACALNLRGRQSADERGRAASGSKPIALRSIIAHPIGSSAERYVHVLAWRRAAAAAAAAATTATAAAVNASAAAARAEAAWSPSSSAASPLWWVGLMARLFVFELAFDGLFYAAHRWVHSVPRLYAAVHKLHHAHTHDVRLLSSLQMGAADVLLTHTLPVLGALALVPIVPGLELSVAKAYLLFQELYGHAGVAHRGRCFGPAPWAVSALGIELRAEDHRRHHICAHLNFSKRFCLWDKLFGTWSGGEARAAAEKGKAA